MVWAISHGLASVLFMAASKEVNVLKGESVQPRQTLGEGRAYKNTSFLPNNTIRKFVDLTVYISSDDSTVKYCIFAAKKSVHFSINSLYNLNEAYLSKSA